MIQFILNNSTIETTLPEGSTVLDFVRYHKRLTGTKIGCREGDCGACTILVGDFENNELTYRSMTSCLMPLVNAHGKHVVTVEGINMSDLTPVQQALVDTNGTQCGFCTIGFVMSLTGFVMNGRAKKQEEAIAAMDGNICRCTGYKSIEKAAQEIVKQIADKSETETISWLVDHQFIPDYFNGIPNRLKLLKEKIFAISTDQPNPGNRMFVGGGTDLVVQKHSMVKKSMIHAVFDDPALKEIKIENGFCAIGASVTVTQFAESDSVQNLFPDLNTFVKLISSTPIRNMATMGGNLVNASPIGDMSIFFLALDSDLILNKNNASRRIKLREFYKAYKQIDLEPGELLTKIEFKIPGAGFQFNFEKVCKRSWLDIASVNSACMMKVNEDGSIGDIHLSAGGVAPFPKHLSDTVSFLRGKKMDTDIIHEAIKILHNEITPIADARGTTDYKRLLLRQLFCAHLIKFFGATEEIRKAILTRNI